MRSWEKISASGVALLTLVSVIACGKTTSSTATSSNKTIVIGSSGSDYQIWQHIAQSPQA